MTLAMMAMMPMRVGAAALPTERRADSGHHHGGAEDGGAGDHQELVGQLAQLGLLAGKPEHAAR